MEVQDLTKLLKLKINNNLHVRFNCSILHKSGNLYYLVYRLFVPNSQRRYITNASPVQWKYGWWDAYYQDTVFCTMELEKNGKFKILSEALVDGGNSVTSMQDCRLYKSTAGQSMIFNNWDWFPYNSHFHKDIKEVCYGPHPCTFVASGKFTFRKGVARLGRVSYPCLNLKRTLPDFSRCFNGQREEKNWCPFVGRSGTNLIQYFINPHIIFQRDTRSQRCKELYSSTCDAINAINTYNKNQLRFLCGTPPIKYNAQEYIGVGHLKYDRKKLTFVPAAYLKNKKLHYEKQCNPKKPSFLVYLMFFYTFSSKGDYRILRLSKPFVPMNSGKYLLAFPMGISKSSQNNNNYLVSYGEADKKTKILTIPEDDIETLLMEVSGIVPRTYKPIFLKKKSK